MICFAQIFLKLFLVSIFLTVTSANGNDPKENEIETKPELLVSLDDYRLAASKILPRNIYDWIAEGTWNEVTRTRNRQRFDEITLWPRYLRNVSGIDTIRTVLGRPIDYPVGISPTSFHKAYHPGGENATAAACDELGTIQIVSYFASTKLQEIKKAAGRCRLWMQIYFKPNRTNNERVIREAEAAGYEAIVITIDSTNYGRPYRQLRNSIVVQRKTPPANCPEEETYEPFVDPALDWSILEWIRSKTKLPIVVRAVINPLDAAAALYYGADAIYVSNHGGRQLDTVSASIDVLGDVVKIVDSWNANQGKDKPLPVDVYFDGGIRTGLDALKAYAMGADMVFLGRPILWGLAVNGSDGVMDVLDSTVAELTNGMQLAGYPVLEQMDDTILQQPSLEDSIEALDSPPESLPPPPKREQSSTSRHDSFRRLAQVKYKLI